jgi:FeS assembly SUF system protein
MSETPTPAPTPTPTPAPASGSKAGTPPRPGSGSVSGAADASPPAPIAPGDAPKPDLRESVIETLQTCFDPEIPVNIYDLGLVYAVDVGADRSVAIKMTLTSPSCPVAETLPPEVERKVKAIPGVGPVSVDLVWDPPWGKHMLSEAARLQLGLY